MGLSDAELLDTIQRQTFQFFVNESDKRSGMVADRAHNHQRGAVKAPSSVAATGFALTAYPIGVERDWIDRGTALALTARTLRFLLKYGAQEHGFFYHFLNMNTGERIRGSEVSPIDTALLMAGVLFAAEYFDDPQIRALAMELYERIDWPWMMHGGDTLALAWSPENGFSKWRWDHYDESMILYLLAIGSPTHPIPASSWEAIRRPVGSYRDYRLITMPPLFTHQYSHLWVDFRDKHDAHADYFQNSVQATLANRAFCIDEAVRFKSYGPNSWGLTASDGPFGYRAYGAPPGWAEHDGTLAPTGCGSSIVFTPEASIACLRHFYEDLGEELWGQYGFSSAFNLDKSWFSQETIGIDQGALLGMIENYRTGFVWEVMGRNVYLKQAMEAVGFQPGTRALEWPQAPEYRAPYVFGGIQVDGYAKDWASPEAIRLDGGNIETGSVADAKDLSAEIRFAWDEDHLYFMAKVSDEDVLMRKTGKNIWQDDLMELYVDPKGDGLTWYDESDFQMGFRVRDEDGGLETWSWFQGGEDPSLNGMVRGRGFVDQHGYVMEGAIRWRYFDIHPAIGTTVGISPALHDIDRDRGQAKLQWFFRNEKGLKQFSLGKIVLAEGEGVQNAEQA